MSDSGMSESSIRSSSSRIKADSIQHNAAEPLPVKNELGAKKKQKAPKNTCPYNCDCQGHKPATNTRRPSGAVRVQRAIEPSSLPALGPCEFLLPFRRESNRPQNPRPMRPIRLPEPPGVDGMETPEIFSGGGGATVVRRAVLIGNGSPGAENQCLGLARALGLADNLTVYRVTRPRGGINEWLHFLPISLHKFIDQVLRQFFRNTRFAIVVQGRKPYRVLNGGSIGLSTVLEADVKKIVTVARDTYEKEGPTLVVACGWDTISYSSLIRKVASDNVFVIQIQHPRSRLDRFDLVVTPRHDFYALTASAQQEVPRLFRRWITPQEPPGSNVVLTVGALHQADSAALRLAAIAWHDELAPLPKPLLVVNIGGPTGNCKYGVDLAKQLISSLYNVLDSCGSVRISFSQRTPWKVADIVFKEFAGHPKVYIWDGEEPNPHMGHLAWADAFVITADSISMLSEACSTGKPVYVIGTEHCKWKFSAFHKTLQERGVVRPFTGLEDISNSWSYPPLNDAIEVATRVREVIAERGWTVG